MTTYSFNPILAYGKFVEPSISIKPSKQPTSQTAKVGTTVVVDKEKLQKALDTPIVEMPQSLSREQKRQHILATARQAK